MGWELKKIIAVKDFLVVLVFSVIAPTWDHFKDWYLVITLLLSNNYAWGFLFSLPVLHGYLGQYLIWRHEEIQKPKNESTVSPRNGLRWKFIFFPVYGWLRNWSLLKRIFNFLRGKSTNRYNKEKDRIQRRIDPVELFMESLPQLMLINAAVTGLIVNSDIGIEKRLKALQNGRSKLGVMAIVSGWTPGYAEYFEKAMLEAYNNSFQEKALKVDDLPVVYDGTEVNSLIDQLDVFNWMYQVSFVIANISLLFYIFGGPVPLMGIGMNKMKKSLDEMKKSNKVCPVNRVITTVQVEIMKVVKIGNLILGPIRQIVLFNLILGVFPLNENNEVIESREEFWIKILIFFGLFALPAAAIQHIFLGYQNKSIRKEDCKKGILIWTQIPFIYCIPIFTGEFVSLRKREKQQFSGIILRQSASARVVYRIYRIISITLMLLVIWTLPNLKVLGLEYFLYIHLINALDAILLLMEMIGKTFLYLCCTLRGKEIDKFSTPDKYGFFHLDNDSTIAKEDSECKYVIENLVTKSGLRIIA